MRRDSLQNEADHLPESVEDLVALRQAILDAGYPEQVANGLIGWMIAKTGGQPDAGSSKTRSQYRKILAELEPIVGPPPDRPDRRLEVVDGAGKGPRKRVRGGRKLASVVALALVSVGGGATAHAPQATHQESSVNLTERTERGFSAGRRRARKAA